MRVGREERLGGWEAGRLEGLKVEGGEAGRLEGGEA
jgi:hypothetical protein